MTLFFSWIVFLLVIRSCIHGMWYVLSCYTILCWFFSYQAARLIVTTQFQAMFICFIYN